MKRFFTILYFFLILPSFAFAEYRQMDLTIFGMD